MPTSTANSIILGNLSRSTPVSGKCEHIPGDSLSDPTIDVGKAIVTSSQACSLAKHSNVEAWQRCDLTDITAKVVI